VTAALIAVAAALVVAVIVAVLIGRRVTQAARGEARAVERAERAEEEATAGRARIDQLEGALTGDQEELAAAQEQLAAAEGQLETAQGDLAAARGQLAAGGSSPGGFAISVAETLWTLEHLRLVWARRDLRRVSTAAPAPDEPTGLAEALAGEVERIREEIGTPGSLQSALAAEPSSPAAALALRTTEALLSVLARRADGYDVHLARAADGRLEIAVICDGTDPEVVNGSTELDELATVIGHAGGSLGFDAADDGRLRARITLPSA
jgi:hypothetical protein